MRSAVADNTFHSLFTVKSCFYQPYNSSPLHLFNLQHLLFAQSLTMPFPPPPINTIGESASSNIPYHIVARYACGVAKWLL
jgi:hypothetical protein